MTEEKNNLEGCAKGLHSEEWIRGLRIDGRRAILHFRRLLGRLVD